VGDNHKRWPKIGNGSVWSCREVQAAGALAVNGMLVAGISQSSEEQVSLSDVQVESKTTKFVAS
jgi:hypothetical protein